MSGEQLPLPFPMFPSQLNFPLPAPNEAEADSQMLSASASSSSSSSPTSPPAAQTNPNPILSPPDSQGRNPTMPPTATGTTVSNSNGKRPLNTISNGTDDYAEQQAVAMANGKARQDFVTQTHQPSGYSWSRNEDEPGYGWLNKKALDEYNRAWDGLVHKEFIVKNRYGDPFEAAEREQAMLNSLQQR